MIYRATAESGSYVCIASGLSALNYFDRSVQADVTYYYQVAVTDTCGNESVYSAAVSASMVADTQVPAITGISTTYQQKISPSTHTIRVSASDNNTLSTVTVEYRTSLDAEWVQLQQQTAINSHYTTLSVALPIDRLTDGDTVYLRAVATDMSGLQSDYATATYTVDTTPPTIETPIVSANGSTVHLRWKDGGEEDLAGFKVYRAQDDGAFATLGSRGVNANGVYTFTDTVTAKESGTYTYKIEAIDKLGNTYAWSQTMEYTYVYVNQAPTAHMSIPSYMTVDMEEVFDASASRDDIGIVSYVWDFGDGTTSTQMRPNKKYAATGTYTVTLTVIDTEGISSIITRDVIVKEREVLGTLKVKVTNDGGNALAHVPVYFDLGSADQRIVYTDHAGIATLSMTSGTHTVGMYAAGYLPVKKDVVVLANATRTVTLTTVEEELVTGEFEVTRMTFDEIAAAGIDVYDPANSHVYSATVRVSYTASKSQLNIHYIRNDNQILDYTITDQSGKPVEEYTNDNGETRKIAGVTYLPNLGSGNSGTGGGGTGAGDADVVAIIDIPASASYLKEFFDVRLHIINNASSEFVLEKNEVVLNVPDGMTLMSGVTGGYSSSNTVTIDKIQGQQTVTLAWVLRGDDAGEYDLSADFTGILAEFNQLVTARFETKEPIKVYGLDGVKFRILTADEIHNDTLYFNVELENERDVDIYMPSIGVTDKVRNVTESVLNNDPDKDFSSRAYILNAYLQTGDGKKQYLAVTYDANGKATTDIQVLAPGQKIVYEYVAYNAADCNDPAYFEKAVITEFEGMIENIEVGSFHKNLYSFTDYTEKLDAILNGTDADVQAAYEHIFDSTRYYYVGESEQLWNSICERVYKSIDAVLDFDIDNFTQDEQRAMVESKILSILADSSVVEAVDDLIVLQYCQSVVDIIDDLESELVANYKDGEETAAEIASFVAEAIKDSKELSLIYANEGYEAFVQALNQRLAGYTIGVAVDVADLIAPSTEYISVSKVFDFGASIIGDLYTGRSQAERDAAYFAILKLQCNAEISNYILESLIQATEKDALERLNELIAEGVLSQASPILAITRYNLNEKEMLHVVAKQMQEDLHKSMDDYRQNWEQIKKTVIQVGGTILEVGVDIVLEKMIGATPIGLIKAAYTIADSLFGCENYYQQMDTMQVDNELSKALILSFQNSIKDRNINTDFYSMLFLRALCETRLSGESQFKSFMDDYINGEYLYARDEEAVLRMINDAMGTGYFDYGAWYDTVMRNIVRSRDVLFNIENTVTPEQPAAPSVTLNYDRLTTVQTFSAQYEYAFADGEWQACDNAPIAFEVGNVPGILQVRKAATDTTLAGKITTVTIFAKKELSKLISARFDGSSYWLSNLSAAHTYELFFADSPDDTPDWAAAITVAGDTEAVQISGVGAHDYLFIRTAHNAALQETASYPRTLTVVKKQALQLQVIGDGIVTQTAADGTYFVGETVELTATAADGERFLGWYIGGECVSTDATYLVEMATDLHVSAQFTENTVLKVSVNNATSGIQVSWTVIGTAIEYGVYQRELADGVWSDWQFVAATTNQRYTVSNTQNGVSYEYKVVALIGGVETGSTTSATVKRVPTPTLTVANGQNGIELSWSVNGTPDESYVYRSEYVDGAWTSWKRIDTTTAFAYTDTAVKNGTKYRYMVRVSVDGLLSSANSGTILQRLNAISPTIENTVSGIKLSWRAHAFASKYFLYRSEWVDGAWTDWSRLITTTDLVYTDLSVKNGVQYRYTVMAVSGEYRSSYTPDAEMIRLTVSSLAATNQTKGIQVQWTENAAADKYYLYRSAYVDDAWTAWEKLCDTDDTAYLDTAAENGVKYRYMVRSVHGDQLSGAKTGDILHRLEASTITMENVPSGIKLSWTANDAASKYFIYRSAYIDGVWTAWERFITTTASTTSYTDYSVTNGVQYRYMVRTMKADDQSIAKAGDPMLRLTTPTVKPTAAANGISLSWTANPYAAKYDLYRRAYDVSTGTYLDWERIVENTKATTYTDTTATKGVTYQYTLRAINVTSISAVKAGANVKW